MVSERKREANRKNAQKPQGPRQKTKAFHPYEDFSTFHWDWELLAELKESYRDTLQPQNKLEESLVEMLCHATLRLKRVPYLEHEYHATHRYGFLFNEKENHFGPFYRAESKLFYQQLSRYEASAQRSFYKALNTLLKLQEHRLFRRGGPRVRPPQPPEPSRLPIPSAIHRERADTRSAPTKETGATPPPTHPCHPDRREGSPKPNTRCGAPKTLGSQGPHIPTPGVQEILYSRLRGTSITDVDTCRSTPCGRDDTGFLGKKRPKSPKKTSQISHQTAPPKRRKTQAQKENSPTANPWLTQKLATVRQKIKAFTQKLQIVIARSNATWQSPESNTRCEVPITSRSQILKTGTPEVQGITTPSARNDKSSLHRCARKGAASPAEKASHPQATSTGPNSTPGPDPPDAS